MLPGGSISTLSLYPYNASKHLHSELLYATKAYRVQSMEGTVNFVLRHMQGGVDVDKS